MQIEELLRENPHEAALISNRTVLFYDDVDDMWVVMINKSEGERNKDFNIILTRWLELAGLKRPVY